VVFDDADVEKAAQVASNAILQNAGQTCSAGSRLLVHERVHAQLLDRIAERFAKVSIGRASTTRPWPARVPQTAGPGARFLDGLETGEVLFGGGIAEPDGITDGAYFMPTLIDGVDPSSSIAQDEVFGPVLAPCSSQPKTRRSPLPTDRLRVARCGVDC